MTEGERDAVIRYNMPRLLDRGLFDEAVLRNMLEVARHQGWMDVDTGLIPGMAGVGVPVFGAAMVVEAEAGAFARWGLHVGQQIELRA